MLSWISFDKLKLYGILLFVVSFIVASIYRIYTLRQFDETRFELVKDKSLYKTLISYSGWTLFGAISMVVKGQGINIMLNAFFGTVVNAAQGVANQLYTSLNSFVANFQMASNPQIVKSYASNNKEYMSTLIIRTSKFSFYLLFIITLPFLFEIEYILKIWLKIVPEYTEIFALLILINAWVDSFSGPLVIAVNATGKIKLYQIIVGIIFSLNLPISYFFFKMGYPPQSTFVINICITLVVFFIRLFFIKLKIPEFTTLLFLKEVLLRSIPILLIAVLIPYFIKISFPCGIIRLIIVVFISISTSTYLIYLLGLRRYEKLYLKSLLKKFILKN